MQVAQDCPWDDAAGNIKVCVRVRPFAAREKGDSCCVEMPSKTQVRLISAVRHPEGDGKRFTVDRAYWSHAPTDDHFASQQTLVGELGPRIIKNILEGFNSTLFAYGQTGAGKTFSVFGSDDCPENRGLLPRILEDLFKQIEALQGPCVQFQCRASYLEVYNEKIRDLLVPAKQNSEVKLEVRHHPTLGIHVPGLLENAVVSYEMVQKIIEQGAKTRSVAATNMNAVSSRSHCIFIFSVDKQEQVDGKTMHLRARMNLVDLAGSERQSKTGAQGDRVKEASMINQSLSNLAAVIHRLAEASSSQQKNNSEFIPFRNSKLTYLLQESLSGNSRTVMMAAVSPAFSNHDETLSTLRFAEMCKSIVTKATKNVESNESIVLSLKAEIERLKKMVGADPEMARKLEESEAVRKKLEQDYQEHVAEAKRRQLEREKALEDIGLNVGNVSGSAGMDPNIPQLINISDDPALSGCLVYFLLKGKDTTLGANKACRIVLTGLGMKPCMCSLRNENNTRITLSLLDKDGALPPPPVDKKEIVVEKKGPIMFDMGAQDVASIRPSHVSRFSQIQSAEEQQQTVEQLRTVMQAAAEAGPPGRVMVNGRAAKNGEIRHTDRLILGHAHCFRLIVPLTAQQRASANGVQAAEVNSIAEALREVLHDHAEEFEQCRTLMESIQDNIGEKAAQEFLHHFGRVLPLVEEGNLITTEVRPKDGLRFRLEVCNDISTFESDQPELVVRLYRRQGDSEAVVDVFEIPQYEQRITHMREIYNDFHSKLHVVDLSQLGSDPWATYSYEEVQHMLRSAAYERDEQAHMREQLQVREPAPATSSVADPSAELRKQLAEREARIAELEREKREREQDDFDDFGEEAGSFECVAGPDVGRIGLVFSSTAPEDVVIKRIVPGMWADQQGIRGGDHVESVNGVSIHEMTADLFKNEMTKRPLSVKVVHHTSGRRASEMARASVFATD